MTANETPRYLVAAPAVYVNCNLYKRGDEVSCIDWPGPGLEPINEAPKLVSAYPRHGRPKSLHNTLIGDLHLPAVQADYAPEIPHTDHSGRLPNPIDASVATADMPKYRSSMSRNIGKVTVQAGAEYVHLGWPLTGSEPVSEAAKQVVQYHEANKDNRHLLPSPWCLLRGLVLPTLPEPPKRDDFAAAMETEIAKAEERNARAARAQRANERQRRARSWESLAR